MSGVIGSLLSLSTTFVTRLSTVIKYCEVIRRKEETISAKNNSTESNFAEITFFF